MVLYIMKHPVQSRQKGDLTQSNDKSPYTNRNVKRAKRQHKQRHKNVRLTLYNQIIIDEYEITRSDR